MSDKIQYLDKTQLISIDNFKFCKIIHQTLICPVHISQSLADSVHPSLTASTLPVSLQAFLSL